MSLKMFSAPVPQVIVRDRVQSVTGRKTEGGVDSGSRDTGRPTK